MLLEFTVRNYRSFRDEQAFSLVASSGTEHEDTHTIQVPRFRGERALRSAVLYGPNASGKTNLLLALKAMREVVVTSAAESQRGDEITSIEPFRLKAKTRNVPTFFEVDFVQDEIRYQYGFEATRERVVEEWLYAYPKGQAQRWYTREYDVKHENGDFNPGDYLSGQRRQIWEATRPNALYLSTAVQLNNEALAPIFDWFRNTLRYMSSARVNYWATIEACEDPRRKGEILSLLQEADLGIKDIQVEEDESEEFIIREEEGVRYIQGSFNLGGNNPVTLQHTNEADKEGLLSLDEESHGTQRYFALAGPILEVIRNGQVLAIDELDSSLHPLLVRAIVDLFNDPASNPNNAQLIFNTHDTTLLDQELFRRDQIWFTEKFGDGASRLIPLLEFKPRKETEALEKNYLQGRYGALPMLRLNRLKSLFQHGERCEEKA